MRIIPSTLVFLASLSLSLSSFVGAVDAKAKNDGAKKPVKSESKSRAESKPVECKSESKQIESKPKDTKPVDAKADANSKIFVYEKSGGFIGVDLKYEKDLSQLSSEERKQLEKLIADSGLLNDKNDTRITGGAADMFHYEFRFKDGSKEHHVRFDDGTLPNSYRPLIDYLKDKVVDQRKSRPH